MRRLLVAAAICLLSAGSASAASTILTPTPLQHFVDNTGFACYNCQLFTYAAGTDTKLNTFTDSTGNTPNTDPIILNARGEASVWLAAGVFYKFVLAPNGSSDPPTNPIWTVDNISALGGSGGLFPSFFEAPAGPTYDLSGTDNGAVIVSSGASAGLALVLPSTTTISSGWTIAIDPSTGHPVSLTVNGSSGGNIITDTGASVTALNNLGNQRIQIQFDGTNFQFATNRKTVVDPRDFGCALDGVTDDTVCFLSAINYAAQLTTPDFAIPNANPVVDCGGLPVFLSATEVIQNATGIAIHHCDVVANPAVNWAGNFPLGMIDAETANNDRNIDISYDTCNGNNVAGCFTMRGHSGDGFKFNHNTGVHMAGFFFQGYVEEGSGNIANQWTTEDPQYCVTADYTATGMHIYGAGDGRYNNDEMSEMGIPFELGLSTDTESSAPGASVANKFEGDHPWIGANTGVCSPQIVFQNAPDIVIHPGSTGNLFDNLYRDNGVVVLQETKNNIFANMHVSYDNTKNYEQAVFDLQAQSAGDLFQGYIHSDGVVGGVTQDLLWFKCDGTGGNFWTISPSACGTATANTAGTTTVSGFGSSVLALGWTTGMFIADSAGNIPLGATVSAIASNGLSLTLSTAATGSTSGDTIYVSNTHVGHAIDLTENTRWLIGNDASTLPLQLGCVQGDCGIGFNGTFSGQVESTIEQNNGNNLQLSVASNPDAFRITADGNVAFPGTAPSCSSGCGSGAAFAGSNVLGHVTLGTSPSATTIVIAWAIQGNGLGGSDAAQGWHSQPNCNVSEPANLSFVTGWAATVTTLTITVSSSNAGNVIRWNCGEEQ